MWERQSDTRVSVGSGWHRGQVEGNWEIGTAIIGDRKSREGAILGGRILLVPRSPPPVLAFSLNPL